MFSRPRSLKTTIDDPRLVRSANTGWQFGGGRCDRLLLRLRGQRMARLAGHAAHLPLAHVVANDAAKGGGCRGDARRADDDAGLHCIPAVSRRLAVAKSTLLSGDGCTFHEVPMPIRQTDIATNKLAAEKQNSLDSCDDELRLNAVRRSVFLFNLLQTPLIHIQLVPVWYDRYMTATGTFTGLCRTGEAEQSPSLHP
ncbi:unnamed protein product [Protopolystoma xenopodis]|uniref:Uncharacterized protein n=1 Tax=Protopolystoma xenopodis TaxID=117903 RepID=A0A3S5B9S7_9PLAT|nr:unnamed protein product [Protopolystoma xenopodis]